MCRVVRTEEDDFTQSRKQQRDGGFLACPATEEAGWVEPGDRRPPEAERRGQLTDSHLSEPPQPSENLSKTSINALVWRGGAESFAQCVTEQHPPECRN